MEWSNRRALGLAALVAISAACSDDPAGPGAVGSLTDAEVAALAEDVADATDGILDGEVAAHPEILPAGDGDVGLSLAPVVEEFEFSRSHECRGGGSVSVNGTGVWVGDRETGVVTIDISGRKEIDDCARARGDVVITLNGGGSVEGHRMKVDGRFSGLQTHDQEGAFSWETSDGRSGECRYEIHVSWNPETHVKTVSGFVCDREIDREVTRERAAGDRRDA